MNVYKMISVLLDYPDQELRDSLGEIAGYLARDPGLSERERKALLKTVHWMEEQPLVDWQAHYVQTFDLSAEHSLHLTHHTFGDSRERGPALVELSEFYKAQGLETAEGELPDYLPLILEYAATLEPSEARLFLAETAKVVDAIAKRLERNGTPYAALLRTIETHGRLARSAA